MLLEGKFTFDVLDLESDFSGLPAADPPGCHRRSTPKLKAKVDAYRESGGRVLLTGMSGIDPERRASSSTSAPKWHGPRPTPRGDYLLPIEPLRAVLRRRSAFHVRGRRSASRSTAGASLGDIYDPYFDRSPQHFSGHVNTPSRPDPSGFDAGSEKGAFTYLAHPIFTAYKRIGAVAMLEIAEKARAACARPAPPMIETVAAARRPRHAAPPAGPEARRPASALRHAGAARLRSAATTSSRSRILSRSAISTCRSRTGKKVRSVVLAPSGEGLKFLQKGGRVSFTVPELTGHQMVEIAY